MILVDYLLANQRFYQFKSLSRHILINSIFQKLWKIEIFLHLLFENLCITRIEMVMAWIFQSFSRQLMPNKKINSCLKMT